jgi:RNA polymerase sigma-70 factor (ECF subfamily)
LQRRIEYAELTDEQLVQMLAAGDAQALGMLSERHARPVYSLALRILRDPGWAEEVAQDVLLRLWTKPELYDSARGDLRRWLLSVAHHAAIDGLRGRRGTARARDGGPEPLDGLAHEGEDPSEAAWRSLRAESVRGALAQLPPPQREAVELVYYHGLSQTEIAAHTGQPLGTVKTRIRLGLQKLKAALDYGEVMDG